MDVTDYLFILFKKYLSIYSVTQEVTSYIFLENILIIMDVTYDINVKYTGFF
jgi:hypothetical protein